MDTKKYTRAVRYFIKAVCHYAGAAYILRISGQMKRMKDLEGSCVGERCFLIGNAPSLTFDDLRKLKDEKTFGCNSLCLAFKELGFSTTYFCFEDWKVYKKHRDIIDSLKLENVFYHTRYICMKEKLPLWEKAVPYNLFPHLNYKGGKVRKFSTKPYKKIYDGFTVVYVMMQIAAFMGFKEMYILGVDCDYTHGKNSNHFAGSDTEGVTFREVNWAPIKMNEAFEKARGFAQKHGIRIYNCTRGGKLEVFERKDLDDVLKEK